MFHFCSRVFNNFIISFGKAFNVKPFAVIGELLKAENKCADTVFFAKYRAVCIYGCGIKGDPRRFGKFADQVLCFKPVWFLRMDDGKKVITQLPGRIPAGGIFV